MAPYQTSLVVNMMLHEVEYGTVHQVVVSLTTPDRIDLSPQSAVHGPTLASSADWHVRVRFTSFIQHDFHFIHLLCSFSGIANFCNSSVVPWCSTQSRL